MRGEVWRLEWRVAVARRRRLALSAAVPVLLLLPVAASGAAPAHRATVYALFVVFFGLFGSAAPVVRDGRRGWVERVLLTGYGARPWLLERTAAHAALDALELAPALAGVMWLEGASPGAGAAAGAVLLALLAANLLGVLTGAAVRSLGEAALVCAAVGLVALHLAGAFRPPAAGTWQEAAAAVNPFLPAVEATRALAGGGVGGGAAASAGSLSAAGWALPAAATALLFAGAWAGAPRVAERLTGDATEL